MAARQNLNEIVATQIREKIIDRVYEPGAKLPNEFQLAEEYGVCRYTIREAIKKLTANNLVEVKRGHGTFVKKMVPSRHMRNMIDIMILDDKSICEIFETRLAIELKTTELAAQRANAEGVARLYQNIQDMQAALKSNDMDKYNEEDINFHYSIAVLSGNPILCEILTILNDMIRHAVSKSAVRHKNLEHSMKGHMEILMHIQANDSEKAVERMREHLDTCMGLF